MGDTKRQQTDKAIAAMAEQTGFTVVSVNYGDSHARMLLYNRRCDRALTRSRRNQKGRKR